MRKGKKGKEGKEACRQAMKKLLHVHLNLYVLADWLVLNSCEAHNFTPFQKWRTQMP